MRHLLVPRLLSLVGALGVLGLGACSELPSTPTYFDDVQPILQANCARCHGAEPWQTSIAGYRLDRFVRNDTTATGGTAEDAFERAASILDVACAGDASIMPPGAPLPARQQDILRLWLEQGTSGSGADLVVAPAKGTRSNTEPDIVVVNADAATTVDQTFAATVRAWDDDADGLIVQLWAHDTTGILGDVPLGAPVGAGQHAVEVDTGQLASKRSFEIYALLDDGFADWGTDGQNPNQTRRTLVDALSVDHGARGSAPTVRLQTPNGPDTLIGSTTISWFATDPDILTDGDALTIDLALVVDGTNTVAAEIATGLTMPNSDTGTYTWQIPATLSTATSYRLRVTATDTGAKNTRSDLSDGVLTIAQPTTTTYTWADAKQVFDRVCVSCHGDPAKTVALDNWRIDAYDAADPLAQASSDLGAYEMRSQIYARFVQQQNMPPASASVRPTAAERELIGNWITGGAPEGASSGDPAPTFTWTSVTKPTTSTVQLVWSATDDTAVTSGTVEYKVVATTPLTGCAGAGTTGWTTVPVAEATLAMPEPTWMATATWTLPAIPIGGQPKYYCFRGVVGDGTSTTTVISTGTVAPP